MDGHLLLDVVTPERKVLSEEVTEVQFPTEHRGMYGILPGHTPVVVPVGDGLVSYVQNGARRQITVFGGFAEVGPERVTLLARESETPEMLDAEALRTAEQDALGRLKAGNDGDAQADLDRIRIRLQALGL